MTRTRRILLTPDVIELIAWRRGLPVEFDHAAQESVLVVGGVEYYAPTEVRL